MTTAERTREIRKMIGKARIFGAEFTTRKGTTRRGSFRLGVTSGLKDPSRPKKPSYNTDEYGNIIAFDMQKRAYRTIPLSRLHHLTVRGRKIEL